MRQRCGTLGPAPGGISHLARSLRFFPAFERENHMQSRRLSFAAALVCVALLFILTQPQHAYAQG